MYLQGASQKQGDNRTQELEQEQEQEQKEAPGRIRSAEEVLDKRSLPVLEPPARSRSSSLVKDNHMRAHHSGEDRHEKLEHGDSEACSFSRIHKFIYSTDVYLT